MINNFVVVEGICCSGKTTLCNLIISELKKLSKKAMYNHGALTYSTIGKKFSEFIDDLSVPFSTLFYFTDLMHNTKSTIIPNLQNNTIVVQDRYIESIATYKSAYGQLTGSNMEVYPAVEVLIDMGLLIKPSFQIFCIPSLEVIQLRMKNAEKTWVHDFYKENPKFLEYVYNKVYYAALSNKDSIIVDTECEKSIADCIYLIKKYLGSSS